MNTSSLDSSFQVAGSNPLSRRVRNSLLTHKRHVLVFIFSIIIGVGVGVALNYGFQLSGGNLVVSRTFKQNQAMQYGRILTNCFGGTMNASISSDNSTVTDEQCHVDRMVITFFVKNTSESGFFLVAHVDDHRETLLNSSSLNASMEHNFTYEGGSSSKKTLRNN